jgi:excisionase family DNA binding protein
VEKKEKTWNPLEKLITCGHHQSGEHMDHKTTFNLSEAAIYLGISRPTLRKIIKDGKIQTLALGESSSKRFSRIELDRWLRGDTNVLD